MISQCATTGSHRTLKAPPPTLTYVEANYKEVQETIMRFLITDILEKKVQLPEYSKTLFALIAKNTVGEDVGGCSGYTAWGELHLRQLSVNPEKRIPGTGTVLMHAVEVLARQRGCTRMMVKTYSWQARPFYEKMGYRVFGTAKDYPKGHERYFMEKVWPAGSAMDVSPYALVGKAAGAAELAVVKADQGEADVRLDKWLNDETQSCHVGGVPPVYDKKEVALVARLPDGSLTAACCYETLWGEMHISYFACCETKKNRGIGSAFLRHLLELARRQGCYRVSLETLTWQAQPFYEQHGFRQFGIQRGIPCPETARVYMERNLQHSSNL